MSFVSAPTYGTTKSARGLADFTAISGSDPDFVGFLASPYFRRVPTTHSRHYYATHLEAAFETYKVSLTGGGGEAAATTKEIEDMKLNAFNGIRDALDQWKSYLEPKEGVDCTLWIASADNKRAVIGSILDLMLEFVPTANEYYSNAIRTNLQNLKKDVARSGGAPHPIADGDLTFATISARITAAKDTLPALLAFKPMGSNSTSRDAYSALADKLITPRTFGLGDMKVSIAWARQRIDWLKKKIEDLSAEIVTLRGSLASNIVTINDTTVPSRGALSTAGVNLGTGGPALILINQLASAFLAERAKVDGVRTAITNYRDNHGIVRGSEIFNLINVIYTATGDTLLT